MKYPKIHTLFNRNPKTFKVIETEIRYPEFANVKNWFATEKVDGTNIRVIFTKGERIVPFVTFAGKTDKAQIPEFLLRYLQKTFTIEENEYLPASSFFTPNKQLRKAFSEEKFPELGDMEWCVILYGEGYGAKIQKGGNYRPDDVSFRLFDVWVTDNDRDNNLVGGWWLEPENIEDIATKLGIDTIPPIVGLTTIEELIQFVKNKPTSIVAREDDGNVNYPMEGIVAKSSPLMLRRNGERVMFKLKQKDFAR